MRILLVIFLLSTGQSAFSTGCPDSLIRHSFYIDLGGQSIVPSFNYDKKLWNFKGGALGYNIGTSLPWAGLHLMVGGNASVFILAGKRSHYMEFGFGYGLGYYEGKKLHFFESGNTTINGNDTFVEHYFTSRERKSFSYCFMKTGYRYYAKNNSFVLRVYIMPVLGLGSTDHPMQNSYFKQTTHTKFHKAAFFPNPTALWGGVSLGFYLIPKKYRKAS
ncbi:MAG: hypothetical protein K1X81_06655 [Bacteroidia bacterium]|nr:hypothetical protein [Bacteroidia bacterium]